jgi:signal transduction histidine kinase
MWPHRRARFVRRLGVLFGIALMLAAVGAVSLLSFVAHHLGMADGTSSLAPVGALAILAVASVIVFARTMRGIGAPLGDIVTAAQRVGDGQFSVTVREAGPRFLRQVARAFNLMTARLQRQDDARRQMMADIAHELRTPLSVMQGRIEGMLDGVYAFDRARLTEILGDVRVLSRLIEDLRTLANADSGSLVLQREPSDILQLVADVVAAFRPRADSAGIALRSNAGAERLFLDLDPIRMREVLANLVDNALQHTPAGGTVSVAVERDAEHLVMCVEDTGHGIAASELPNIFDRFYKGSTSRGSGLGLAIARKLVIAHGGDIVAVSEAGTGTTMIVTLPYPS